ncbi:hypothetical protein MJN47_31275, partial [Salmonella enterica subsp. enterica serovar Lubbock]|nr:hypothetical protein [Salmonella enterica subsp. enterica serovar Lubbock]
LHGLPYSIAPDTQKHVPMLIWLSKDYQQRYQVDQACLQKRASAGKLLFPPAGIFLSALRANVLLQILQFFLVADDPGADIENVL